MITEIGILSIEITEGTVKIKSVVFVSNLGVNLISLTTIEKKGVYHSFENGKRLSLIEPTITSNMNLGSHIIILKLAREICGHSHQIDESSMMTDKDIQSIIRQTSYDALNHATQL